MSILIDGQPDNDALLTGSSGRRISRAFPHSQAAGVSGECLDVLRVVLRTAHPTVKVWEGCDEDQLYFVGISKDM